MEKVEHMYSTQLDTSQRAFDHRHLIYINYDSNMTYYHASYSCLQIQFCK